MNKTCQTYSRADSLFPDTEERIRVDDNLTRALQQAHARVLAGFVVPTLDMGTFATELAAFDFQEARRLDDVLAWTVAMMERGVVHLTHPRYLGLFNPAPTFPAQCADRIAAVFNPQLATSTTSPVAVELESHVIRAVAERAGFPATSSGHFTTGGAEANYTAVICALTRTCPAFAADGARAFDGRPTFYVSNEAHLAWLKIAHQCGIGRSSVRLVATDGCGRMDMDALTAAIAADQSLGNRPFMIVATAGTTNAGMIDPLEACGTLAHRLGVWYHVDAAWGGAALASDRLRPLLSGIRAADSITIDAHKWFATTMGCGMFILKDAALLSTAFQVATTYMPSNLRHRDPYVTSVQWSRRFLGLRLFLSLAAAGWDGYAGHIERSVEIARYLRDELVCRGWTIMNESSLAVLCMRPPAGSADERSIVARVLESGRAWISTAVFEGHDVIRACVTHGETTRSDIDEVVSALETARGLAER